MVKVKNRVLQVLMNGVLIGQLEKNSNGKLSFTYEKTWLETPGSRPVSLSLPLVEKTFVGEVVYNFFDNLLPDNPEIRARIQAKFHITTDQPFDLLACIGKDCVGAIQLVDGNIHRFEKKIKYEILSNNDIAAILKSRESSPLGMTDTTDDFRISIAGAQEKSAFLYHRKKWCRPLDATPTSHIFKLPIGYIKHNQIDLSESCENEWLCLKIAAAFGLPVAKSEIMQFDDVKVLVVERFDRKLAADKSWLMRLPQEDMCQALGKSSNLKYQANGGPGIQEIMRLLLGSANSTEDRDLFYRAQVLFYLLAAIDGHAKNFSIFLGPEGKYQLTPLYDIISAFPLIARKQLQFEKIKLAMALQGKTKHYLLQSIQRRHFIETAKAAQYSAERAEGILDEMLGLVEVVIERVGGEIPVGFPMNIVKPIFAGMRKMREALSE